MDRAWLRAAQKLEFRDPAPFLVRLRKLGDAVARSALPENVRSLRTNSLKEWREAREAAIFCYGMGQRIGQPVYLARGESQDYDFVATWVVGEEQHLAPIQLKEVVPHKRNAMASLQSTIDALTKYADSGDLTVAIHLNQQTRFNPAELSIPKLNIAALWVFASLSPDQSLWGLWGNFLETYEGTQFDYDRPGSR